MDGPAARRESTFFVAAWKTAEAGKKHRWFEARFGRSDREGMIGTLANMLTAVPVAALVCVVPGFFWARLLWPSEPGEGWIERITLSAALSLALVPAVALAFARLLGTGVTTFVAASSVVAVFAAGLAAYALFGSAKGSGRKKPAIARPPASLGTAALFVVALAFAVVLASNLVFFGSFWTAASCWGWSGPACEASGSAQKLMPLVALAMLAAGAFQFRGTLRESSPPAEVFPDDEPRGWRRFLLPAVLLVVVVRNYAGVVVYDWPFVRGVDHYSHAVMANRMMFEGRIEPYFVYPSGFHLVIADISRLGGLDPLEIYPILGPLLPILPVVACHTLAKRLWGWRAGVGAAFFCGLVIGGPYYYLTDSMYPNLVAAQFLLVLTVAALAILYAAPTARAALLVAFLGSSVVLYHQVSSLYLALLLAAVSVSILPYLLLRERSTGLALFSSLAALSIISFFYAWDIYDLPGVIAASLGLTEAGATRDAVSSAIGTQNPFGVAALLGTVVSQPVSWLALLGIALAAGMALRAPWTMPQKLACLTVILWALVLFLGSLTPLSGFPQRFGRDLGVPLALFAAFALVPLVGSLSKWMPEGRVPSFRPAAFYVAVAAVLLVGGVAGLRLAQTYEQADGPSWRMTTTEDIAEAGAWLEANNDGGNIMVGPQRTQVPSRMMLAMGDYSALQSFTESNINLDRDLPPRGAEPLEDVLAVMYDPSGTAHLLEKHDIRYVVHYKDMPDREVVEFWRAFENYPALYRTVFENPDVVIFEPRDSFADVG